MSLLKNQIKPAVVVTHYCIRRKNWPGIKHPSCPCEPPDGERSPIGKHKRESPEPGSNQRPQDDTFIHYSLALFQLSYRGWGNPPSRDRTSDLKINSSYPLQSRALPTELSGDSMFRDDVISVLNLSSD
ncbi:hypothetical protein PCANC_11098 [Puccinia coronata f. sp. avenae]|uniref:Uncharacterized protein n=1 Tax=Puccinia coronata f. sp. avenae TaxID=200324 RepID=A0A2N5UW21_9BASI|nr:hypothetical protein PCANC_16704 [Puccinia coronata f. sp. avenae]PLW29521.1 hypothetical protein PCASD_18737 [Puccinia coronata f. sp. avenae]PLW33157.1 hypothetical protein PCASD_13163 [Puccinia coronata f. sp. avenae]PLW41961.1 hypothetical protein PCANC_11098 [Puccinia coronata f. sp. avenae]